MGSLHLRESSVNSLQNKLWNSNRRVASPSAVWLRIADDQDAWLVLEKFPHDVVAQVPHLCDFSNRIMPNSKLRSLTRGGARFPDRTQLSVDLIQSRHIFRAKNLGLFIHQIASVETNMFERRSSIGGNFRPGNSICAEDAGHNPNPRRVRRSL